MSGPTRHRKRPVVIEAMQWDGNNSEELTAFAGPDFAVIDEDDRPNTDDPDATAQVYDKLHSTWVLVFTGDWIIRGVAGEFYPCRDDVFRQTYEVAGA